MDITIAVKEIAVAIGVASSEILPHYIDYYIASSIAFMILGLITCIIGIFAYRKLMNESEECPAIIVGIIVVFIGVWIFFYHAGNLFAPEGVAIHQLITDVRGK